MSSNNESKELDVEKVISNQKWIREWGIGLNLFLTGIKEISDVAEAAKDNIRILGAPKEQVARLTSLGLLGQFNERPEELRDKVAEFLESTHSDWLNWQLSKPTLPTEESEPTPEESLYLDKVKSFCHANGISEQASMRLGSIINSCQKSLERPGHSNRFLSSLFVMAMSNLEMFFSSMVRQIYLEFPTSLNLDKAPLSWDQIRNLNSIDELKSTLLDIGVNNQLNGPFIDWVNWFSEERKLIEKNSIPNVATISNYMQMRHAIVHNGGRHSDRTLKYFNALEGEIRPANGDLVVISEDFLKTALSQLCTFSVFFWLAIVAKLQKDRGLGISAYLSNFQLRLLDLRHFEALVKSRKLFENLALEQNDLNIYLVNIFQAMKALGDTSYLSELSQMQFDDGAVFELARKILREDYESARADAFELLKNGKITAKDWLDWPIFEPLRSLDNGVKL